MPAPVRVSLSEAVTVGSSTLLIFGPNSAENEDITADTPSLLKLYDTGSKTVLSKSQKPLLAVLCAIKFGWSQKFDSMRKEQLLDQLHEAVSQDHISFVSIICSQ